MNWALSVEQASRFAALPLAGLRREYPNSPGLVLNGPDDLRTPKELHPAFYGCFDWHSSVHGHWMLVRLLKRFDLDEATAIRELLNENLTAQNLQREADYFEGPHRGSFERTYGWAWLLKLAEELHGADDVSLTGSNGSGHGSRSRGIPEDMAEWSRNLRPLEQTIVGRYLDFLPKATYPIRTGLHANSAFGLSFAHDYAAAVGHEELRKLTADHARSWFGADVSYPAHLEPGGADFFSPCLMEADLMRRVLSPSEFALWFSWFLPEPKGAPTLLSPVCPSDRTDGQIAHLDGLNLSRAWCMLRIGDALPEGNAKEVMLAAASAHAEVGLANVATGDYAGEHWLASFAVYLAT